MDATGRRVLATTSAVGSLLLVAGCGGGAGPSVSSPSNPGTSSPQAAATSSVQSPSPSTSASSTRSAPTFHQGQCLNDSPQWTAVPCTDPHGFEVTAVVQDDRYQDDLVKRAAYRTWLCDTKLDGYLGGPASSTLLLAESVPPAGDPDSAEQIVCLVRHARAAATGSVQDTKSLKGVLKGKGRFTYRICLSNKASEDAFNITPCDGPHVSEATWSFSLGGWKKPFPGEEAINKTSLQRCRSKNKAYLGGVTRSDISFAQNSSGESAWKAGHRITTCFVQVDHGEVTGTMHDLKNGSLADIR